MKKSILKITTVFCLFMSMTLLAQDFQGKAYYQTKRKIDIKIDELNLSEAQEKQMQAMLKKRFERTYILTFNNEASIYQGEVELDKPQAPTSGGLNIVIRRGGDQKQYKNTKTKTYVDEQDVFGKEFLIKDELEVFNWELGEESKVIGKYLCFKATATREVEKIRKIRFGENADDEDLSEFKKEMETETITAWYTVDIPISNGPDEFWGLPGLILELHDGDEMQYACTKIVMNTNDKISEPTKGKVVNQEQYNEIRQKKLIELQKQELQGRERPGEDRMEFRIGG